MVRLFVFSALQVVVYPADDRGIQKSLPRDRPIPSTWDSHP